MASYEEAREEYCRVMGEDLGTAYHLLWNKCALLHVRWEEYVEMFGSSQANFDTMNEVAPGFFKSVQDTSWHEVLLYLCRFADPAIVGYKRTLSLEALLKFPASQRVKGLKQLIDEAKSKIKFAQDWRNRWIAHSDLDHAKDSSTKPLAAASRVHVREALAAIVAVLTAVEMEFTGSTLGFLGTSWNWGGLRLLSELRLIARLRQEREDRINTGKGTADDFDYDKWR